ncbi:MAG: 5-oxoprolinase subunit PxpB [Planctomycetota bacterium]
MSPATDLISAIHPLGDAALTVGPSAGSCTADGLHAWAAACRQAPLAGVTDVVAAFGKLGVTFDPASVPSLRGEQAFEAVCRWLMRQAQNLPTSDARQRPMVEILVVYGGEHGPDLEAVATHAGITPDEVIARHQASELTVAAVGFAPGFAYLEGLPPELQTPRRSTPRVAVPAGAVAIGGPYTGVYPRESPGGWNLIGRTAAAMFAPERTPQSLLAAGDRVRFRAVDELPPLLSQERQAAKVPSGAALFRVVRPGVQSTLQDLGRTGHQHTGVTTAGAMDRVSLQVANLLAANSPGAAALELTLSGPVLECLADTDFALAGALPPGYAGPARKTIARGETLDLAALQGGARCYLAVPGGFAADAVLGSTATDLRAGFGGHSGRALVAGDLLYAANDAPLHAAHSFAADWHASSSLHSEPGGGDASVLHVLPGPHCDLLPPDALKRLTRTLYTVDPQSNRMGVRCQSPNAAAHNAVLSESVPVAHGSVQLPADGHPIVLGADRQTLGGYPLVACVVSADLPTLGQLRPGDRLRFEEVDMAQAQRLRDESERALGLVALGIANALQSKA